MRQNGLNTAKGLSVKLNLGCGSRHFPGFLSVDLACPVGYEGDFQQADLNGIWPFPTSFCEEVLAYSVLEHLRDKIHTMNELHRILRPGGIARIQLPDASEGDGGHCDPTHKTYWTRSDFEYYHPGIAERDHFRGHGEYARITADFKVVSMSRHMFPRHWGAVVWEIFAVLEAIK